MSQTFYFRGGIPRLRFSFVVSLWAKEGNDFLQEDKRWERGRESEGERKGKGRGGRDEEGGVKWERGRERGMNE